MSDFSNDSNLINTMVEVDADNKLGNMDLKIKKTDFATRIRIFNEETRKKIYRNFSSPKGLVAIINNKNFTNLPTRNGTEYDEQKLLQLFLEFGYAIMTKHDLTKKEMLEFAKSIVNNKANKAYDSFVIVVLTHGKKDILCGSDGEHVNIDDFLGCFHSDNAPFLAGKPKLFFIQACRGNFRDLGTKVVDQKDDGNLSSSTELKHPVESDMLIAYATTPNKVSYRNPGYGSWFIRSICEVFSEHAASENILTLLTGVNSSVSEYQAGESGEKQMPSHVHQLLKTFYFFPGDDSLFALQQGPDDVVSKRTMKSDVIVKQNGEVQIKTALAAKDWLLRGFRGYLVFSFF